MDLVLANHYIDYMTPFAFALLPTKSQRVCKGIRNNL
jgi:hypothetical protein